MQSFEHHLFISIRLVLPLLHSTCPGQQCQRLTSPTKNEVVHAKSFIFKLTSCEGCTTEAHLDVYYTLYNPCFFSIRHTCPNEMDSCVNTFQSQWKPQSAPAERGDCCRPSLKRSLQLSAWLYLLQSYGSFYMSQHRG